MPELTLPPYIPPLPSADDLNSQNDVAVSIQNVIAEGAFLPIILGEAQVGGKIFAIDYNSGTNTWTAGVAWCVGQCSSIQAVYLNGAAAVGGVTRTDYLGTTTQTADSTLSSAISGYTDTLVITRPGGDIGVCYSVFTWTDTHYRAIPQFVAQIRGQLYGPASSWTANPAVNVSGLIQDDILGLNDSVDATSVSTVESDNNDLVPPTTGTARRQIGIVIDKPMPFVKWLRILAVYMSAWLTKRGDTWYFVSDRPRATDDTLGVADWTSFKLRIKDKDLIPTRVEVAYTDTSENIWRTRTVARELTGVSTGAVPRRVSRVRMPGVTRYKQAYREAQERLDKLQNFLIVEIDAVEDHLDKELGDVLSLSRGTHLPATTFRVTSPPVKAFGAGITMQLTKYNSADYDDTDPSDPTFGANDGFLGGGTIDGGAATIYRQASAPVSPNTGDLWYETDSGILYGYNGSVWELVATGNQITRQASAPGSPNVLDLWFETDTGTLWRWSGSAWELIATEGATAGTNLYDAAGNVLFDNVFLNFDDASALNFNSNFGRYDTTPGPPNNWAFGIGDTAQITREETLVLSGPYAVRISSDGTQTYILRDSGSTGPTVDMDIPVDSILVGSFDCYVVTNTSGDDGPGVLVDMWDGAAYYRKNIEIDRTVTGRWQRYYFKLSQNDFTSSSGTPTLFDAIRIYLMGSWTGFSGSTLWNGEIVFDNIRFSILSPNVENESQLWADISGAGLPADDATENNVFRQASAPTGQNGDIWFETDTNLVYQYFSGAWQIIGSYNTGDLADQNTVNTGDIDSGAVTSIAFAESATAANVNSTTFQDVISVTIDLGSDITDVDVFLVFSGDLIVTGYNTGNGGLSSIQLRVLDNGNTSRDTHQYDVTPHHPLQELDNTSAGLGRYYYKAAAQTSAVAVDINGWSAPGGGHNHATAFTITVVSGTEFELDEAGTYLILATFSVLKSAGSGSARGSIQMQDRTSAGSYATTPGTLAYYDSASTSSQYDSVSISTILDVSANHRFKFRLTPLNATTQIVANSCSLTILQIGSEAIRFSGSPQTLQAVSTVFKLDTGLVAGNNSLEIEGRVLSTSGLSAANFNERKLLAFARKR